MDVNYVGVIFFLGITGTIGWISLASPLIIAKCLLFRFNAWDETWSPKICEARRLINDNPEAYAKTFCYQLIGIRGIGVVAWLMFLCGLALCVIDLCFD